VKVRGRKVSISLAAVLVFFLAIYWSGSDKRAFVKEIQDQLRLGTGIIDLSKTMGDEWETVCHGHGYDEPITLKKYGRTYDPVGSPQDGAWGLIFIKKNGSFDSITGSCRQGFNFDFGCLDRRNAILAYSTQDDACTSINQRKH
jgi:hypothetical protein